MSDAGSEEGETMNERLDRPLERVEVEGKGKWRGVAGLVTRWIVTV